MSEYSPESPQVPPSAPAGGSNAVWIAMIIAVTIVTLACVLACAFLGYVFLVNAPW